MVGEKVPSYFPRAKITDLIKMGTEDEPFPPDKIFRDEDAWGFSKPIIFNPELDVFLYCGSHFINGEKSNPSEFVFSEQAELKLLHYKYLSEDYVVNRYKQLGVRLSKYNLDREYGLGWLAEENKIREQHRAYLSLATQVI